VPVVPISVLGPTPASLKEISPLHAVTPVIVVAFCNFKDEAVLASHGIGIVAEHSIGRQLEPAVPVVKD